MIPPPPQPNYNTAKYAVEYGSNLYEIIVYGLVIFIKQSLATKSHNYGFLTWKVKLQYHQYRQILDSKYFDKSTMRIFYSSYEELILGKMRIQVLHKHIPPP